MFQHINIDVGGTFTDCLTTRPDGRLISHKLLSDGVYRGRVADGSTPDCIVTAHRCQDPPGFFVGWGLSLPGCASAASAVLESDPVAGRFKLARPLPTLPRPGALYELSCGLAAPLIGARWLLGKRLDEPLGPVELRIGTTRGTNALLERKGAATVLVITSGFRDLLRIGYQSRPRLFDLNIRQAPPLYRSVIEAGERIAADGAVLTPLDADRLLEELRAARRTGAQAVAVCLLNSYRNPAHELLAESVARAAGFEHVSLSARLSPEQRIVPRGETTVVDAYLAPLMQHYVAALEAALPGGRLRLMSSAGSLTRAADFHPKDSILSGPAAGMVGAAAAARAVGFERIIAFDMGGTSTDVSRFGGEFERRHELLIEDPATGGHTRVRAPMLAIDTVAAGGGSICGFDGVKPTVGPQSAGASPGPACYGRGGPLCLTDINLFLGHIPPAHFPMPLNLQAALDALDARIKEIAAATGCQYQRHELAAGYVAIANAHMAGALRRVSLERGYDPREHALVSFGGAGGQHACALARELEIRTIVCPPLPGFLSAYGISTARISRHAARDVGRRLAELSADELNRIFSELEATALAALARESIEQVETPVRTLDLRYRGQDATLPIHAPDNGDWHAAFASAHRQAFGFTLDRPVEIRAARVELAAAETSPSPPSNPTGTDPSRADPSRAHSDPSRAHSDPSRARKEAVAPEAPNQTGQPHPHPPPRPTPVKYQVWSENAFRRADVYQRADLHPRQHIAGPALIVEPGSTLLLESGWNAEVHPLGHIILRAADGTPPAPPARSRPNGQHSNGGACDPVTLELFNNHFTAIAEQMGAALQRTAISTNIKERLDFSCAVFDAEGGLVANAAHIPVHLGAMGFAARCLLEDLRAAKQALRVGDVYVTNDPYRGGSHLPDITVITPLFDARGERVLLLLANRAHHAEIGGITPGSMPPESRSLADEGVLIRNLRLTPHPDSARGFDETQLRRLLSAGPHPSRAVEQNIADIQAQIAANHVGLLAGQALLDRYGVDLVLAYMRHMQSAAEELARDALRKLGDGEFTFADALDDGTPIAVRIRVRDGAAEFDFSGSGPVSENNFNATPAIVASAVLYCVRCLIARDVPLNAGLLAPLTISIPPGLLNPPMNADPARCPAVAAGNVETSQRIVDCILGALGLAAASQGTMNNLTFGNEGVSYYETIAGGAGAGPGFDGASAVHTHMTNTRLTDPEVLEERYPVRVRRFGIRESSGGAGRWRGGDGVVREIEFLAPLHVSLLTQRRERAPFGLNGGGAGAAGRNILVRSDGREEQLAGLIAVDVRARDALRIETPGGGGWGATEKAPETSAG